jgi:glycosyltransferase involved in cell wall biosynthesis
MGLLLNYAVLMSRPTGISTYAEGVLPGLAPLEPTLLSPFPLDRSGVTWEACPSNLSPESGIKGHARRLLWTQGALAGRYQVLQQQSKAALLFSPLPEAPLFKGCRSVVMVHDLIPLRCFPLSHPLRIYHQTYVPLVLRAAQHIVCNSQATAQDIQDFYNISSHKITPILLGYDATTFRPLNLPTLPYFLYLGRTAPYKNVERVIEAFARIAAQEFSQGAPVQFSTLEGRSPQRESTSKPELWLAGGRDRRTTPQLQALAARLGVESQVRWLDYVPDSELPILLNQAIALVWPSLWEGFGLPVLEAMACGTPVITSQVASLPEVVGRAGILVDPLDIEAIAAAMAQLATDASGRSHLKQQGLAQAATFSWAKTGAQTRQVLERFL